MPRDGEAPTDFAGRLARAIELSGKSPTRVGRETKLGPAIFRLLGTATAKPTTSPGPDIIQRLSDYLGVSYEWLAIGRGPMRYDDPVAATPHETAARFVARAGLRADAITAATTRFAADAKTLTAVDWVLAFVLEARRLEADGTPRPEELLAKARRLKSELEELERAGVVVEAHAPSKRRSKR